MKRVAVAQVTRPSLKVLIRVLRSCRGPLVAAALVLAPISTGAQNQGAALINSAAPNCRVATPPDSAGLAVTPGGFVMVFPRNEGLNDQYTGCKMLWLVDTDRTPRLATLYFEGGALVIAVAHDARDPSAGPEGACAFPEGRSLLRESGRRFGDSACKGLHEEALYALRVPTWPRLCLSKPDAAACTAEPR